MKRNVFLHFVVLTITLTLVNTANIFDLLWNDEDTGDVEKREDETQEGAQRTCACNGPTCICCIDFNLTYIDLGGPGCVRLKYISQDEGIAVNVSYGDSLLHSEQVKGPNPDPTCMSLLTSLAEVCARFVDLLPHNDGLRGCLLFEPKLLGSVTARFNIGCFTMGPEGMKLEPVSNSTITTAIIENENDNFNSTENDSEGLNEEELIAAVNESAEQGLVFFGNLLGLTFGKQEVNATNSEITTTKNNTQTSTT